MDAFLPQSSSALLSRKSKQSCKHSPYLGIFIFCYTSQLLLVCFILFIRLFSCFTGPSILSRTTETENAIKDGSTNSFRGRRKSPHSRTRSLNLNEVSSLGAIHFTDLGTLSYQSPSAESESEIPDLSRFPPWVCVHLPAGYTWALSPRSLWGGTENEWGPAMALDISVVLLAGLRHRDVMR